MKQIFLFFYQFTNQHNQSLCVPEKIFQNHFSTKMTVAMMIAN